MCASAGLFLHSLKGDITRSSEQFLNQAGTGAQRQCYNATTPTTHLFLNQMSWWMHSLLSLPALSTLALSAQRSFLPYLAAVRIQRGQGSRKWEEKVVMIGCKLSYRYGCFSPPPTLFKLVERRLCSASRQRERCKGILLRFDSLASYGRYRKIALALKGLVVTKYDKLGQQLTTCRW